MSKRSTLRKRQAIKRKKNKKLAKETREQAYKLNTKPPKKSMPKKQKVPDSGEKKTKKPKKQKKLYESKEQKKEKQKIAVISKLLDVMNRWWELADFTDNTLKFKILRWIFLPILTYPIYSSYFNFFGQKFSNYRSLFESWIEKYHWLFTAIHSKILQSIIHFFEFFTQLYYFKLTVQWFIKLYIFLGDSYIWWTSNETFIYYFYPILSFGFLSNLRKIDIIKGELVEQITIKKVSLFFGTFGLLYLNAEKYLPLPAAYGKTFVILTAFATILYGLSMREIAKDSRYNFLLSPNIPK